MSKAPDGVTSNLLVLPWRTVTGLFLKASNAQSNARDSNGEGIRVTCRLALTSPS